MKSTFKKQMVVHAKNSSSRTGLRSTTSTNFVDPASFLTDGKFIFKTPPLGPVFEPTLEEFSDPLAYVQKIRPIAEKCGICKIRPPPEWQPPFAVDVDNFKFTPRVQKLNELDANTRVKLYFLDRLATYWLYTGMPMKFPFLDNKLVDMYSLYKIVELEGGFEEVNEKKLWTKVSQRLGYEKGAYASTLKQHYKRFLLPYDRFAKEKFFKLRNGKKEPKQDEDSQTEPIKSEPVENVPGVGESPSKSKRCTRSNCTETDTEILVSESLNNPGIREKNKELQRLTFFGPGPKMFGSNAKKFEKVPQRSSLAEFACVACEKGDSEVNILTCDVCEDGYHTYCLVPSFTGVSKREWRCPQCVAAVVNKPNDNFGFEQAEKQYTLQQFGEMAEDFKSNYFKKAVHLISCEEVEQEYWRILSSMDSAVTVEYGADLHSMEHGSGFPTADTLTDDSGDSYKDYVESSWNLNNIPVLEGSVLNAINADISGMKIPWMYVGMCFSTFCWHNEDHWSYSINYLHWGDQKTWYGVPGGKAEEFEKVMQDTTPDLFLNQPDLLHQLVTNLNPNILMDRGVPVYRVNQCAGEFVLTFPRSYHAGFNHGYNFAEAVNFAPPDWIPMGRDCVEHYSSLRRVCVFSHDELICKMAENAENLPSNVAMATYEDMVKMLLGENKRRKEIMDWGVVDAERATFENFQDDERQCFYCNTTCFLSAVVCKCSDKKLSCLRHYVNLCMCPPSDHTLKYRYTLDELPALRDDIMGKCGHISDWVRRVEDALNCDTPRTITLDGLRKLLGEAVKKNFPSKHPCLNALTSAIKSTENALAVNFKNIISPRPTLPKKITIEEIKSYYGELLSIPCVLPQEKSVKKFLDFVEEYKKEANEALQNSTATASMVEDILKKGNYPNVEIEEIPALKRRLLAAKWIEQVELCRNDKKSFTFQVIDNLLANAALIKKDAIVESVYKEMKNLKENIAQWESKCKHCLNWKHLTLKPSFSEYEELMDEAGNIDAFLPSYDKIRVIVKKAKDWKEKVDALGLGKKNKYLLKDSVPFVDLISTLINDESSVGVNYFHEISHLQSCLFSANAWNENSSKIFLRMDDPRQCLFEALAPRKDIAPYQRDRLTDATNYLTPSDLRLTEFNSEEIIMEAFERAEKRELELVRSLRVRNIYRRSSAEERFCICNSRYSDSMTECSLCKNLFHDSCIKRAESDKIRNYYLCNICVKTRRPRMEKVIELVMDLRNISVRIPEGVAADRLVQRALAWKNEVKALLARESLDKNDHELDVTRLSVETWNEMENTLLRGQLIELDLPEISAIWKIFTAKTANKGSDANNGTNSKNINREIIFPKNELFQRVDGTNSGTKCTNYSKELTVRNESPQKVDDSKSLITIEIDDDSDLEEDVNIKPKRANRSPSNSPTKKAKKLPLWKGSKRKKVSSKNSDLDELCDAKNCLKPAVEAVDWVQCDYCKSWLHMICIGVTASEIENESEFLCTLCRGLKETLLFPSPNLPKSVSPTIPVKELKNNNVVSIDESEEFIYID